VEAAAQFGDALVFQRRRAAAAIDRAAAAQHLPPAPPAQHLLPASPAQHLPPAPPAAAPTARVSPLPTPRPVVEGHPSPGPPATPEP
jgi:hypothetical protein